MRLKTFKEWSNLGYRIHKGQHSVGRNEDNEPLFNDKQVWYPDCFEDNLDDDADFAQAYRLPWGA
jgi:hypothetical protein